MDTRIILPVTMNDVLYNFMLMYLNFYVDVLKFYFSILKFYIYVLKVIDNRNISL